jgi:predicted transcriptional regulator
LFEEFSTNIKVLYNDLDDVTNKIMKNIQENNDQFIKEKLLTIFQNMEQLNEKSRKDKFELLEALGNEYNKIVSIFENIEKNVILYKDICIELKETQDNAKSYISQLTELNNNNKNIISFFEKLSVDNKILYDNSDDIVNKVMKNTQENNDQFTKENLLTILQNIEKINEKSKKDNLELLEILGDGHALKINEFYEKFNKNTESLYEDLESIIDKTTKNIQKYNSEIIKNLDDKIVSIFENIEKNVILYKDICIEIKETQNNTKSYISQLTELNNKDIELIEKMLNKNN